MAIRNIRVIGDEILTKKAKEVKEMTDKTRELVQDMLDTMYEADGVGLAAPQVGILKRIAVIDIESGAGLSDHIDQSGYHSYRRRAARQRGMLKCAGKSRYRDKTQYCARKSL